MDNITCSKTGHQESAVRQQVCLAHKPKTITCGREDFLINQFRRLPPRPKQGWWQKNISSWSLFRAEQEPLKEKNKSVW